MCQTTGPGSSGVTKQEKYRKIYILAFHFQTAGNQGQKENPEESWVWMQGTFPKRNKELQQTPHQKPYTQGGNRMKYLLYWEGGELLQLFFKNKRKIGTF